LLLQMRASASQRAHYAVLGAIQMLFPPNDRAALETVERRFLAAALDYGCTEIAARSRVSVVMRRLRSHLERQRANEKKLEAVAS
jgi:hypothetical protein